MHIDKELLIKDRDRLERILTSTCNFRKHCELGPYYSCLNEMLYSLSPEDGKPEIPRGRDFSKRLRLYRKKLATQHMYFLEENEDFFIRMLSSFNDVLDETNFQECLYFDALKVRFTEKEFKEMIYDFYSRFGDSFYKICKKYFDERRIELGYSVDYELGGFLGITGIKSGYIIGSSDILDVSNMSTIIHELGHAIDAELFLFPQNKKIPFDVDYFGEIPSIFFELMFIDYLKKNRIDGDAHAILLNERFDFYSSFEGMFKTVYASEDSTVDYDATVILDDGSEIDMYQAIVYSLGSYFGIVMSDMYSDNFKGFEKDFLSLISRRKESSIKDMISYLGLSEDEFLSSEIIKNRVVENNMVLKRRFG